MRLPPDHFKTIDPSIYAWKIALLYGFHIFNCSMKDTVIVMNSHRDPLCWQSDASKGQKYSRQHSLLSFERIYVVMLFCIIQCVTMKHFKYFKIILLLCVLKTVWSNRKYFWEMVRTWWRDLNFILVLVWVVLVFFTFSSNEKKEAARFTKILPQIPTKKVYSTYTLFKLKCMYLKLVASLCGR